VDKAEERKMATTEKNTAPTGDDFVRLYPANTLKEQVRDPKDTLSAFTVLKATFFTQK
jgi:hypothetical protein